ncbi:tRNA pseudouridine synthase A [Fibrobacterales bacterium]|nr:tRNA pseudouridine synthase A [Fibrobacterales bacterium]
MRYRFVCEYNGFAFCGWQEQTKNNVVCEKTVQSELENAFEIALKQKIKIVGSGRTDSGVHSRGQVAHFDFFAQKAGDASIKQTETLTEELNCRTVEKSVNALTCKDVCIRNLEQCSNDFHARYSATERYYIYTLCNSPIVLGREYIWECGNYNLNFSAMESEAKKFLGTKDFNSFSIPRNDGKSTECTLTEFRVEQIGGIFKFHIRGNRFLHRQVRSMVGLLFDVGRDRYPVGSVEKVFSDTFKGERTWAPPQGLVLEGVGY